VVAQSCNSLKVAISIFSLEVTMAYLQTVVSSDQGCYWSLVGSCNCRYTLWLL